MGRRSLVLLGLVLFAACSSNDPDDRHPLGKADNVGSCVAESGELLCGGQSEGTCWCDDRCEEIGDCCEDKPRICECPADGCSSRRIEVLLTEPFCDVCSAADKEVLLERSPIIARVVGHIDVAEESIDVAQFTFSRRPIEEALLRARDRGVEVRVAMDAGQDRPDSLSTRLLDAGVNVRFIEGRDSGAGFAGLMHAKFLLVDGDTLLTGSNNWSSTGTSINEENTMVIMAPESDPLIEGFACHFETIWESRADDAVGCSTGEVTFAPGAAAVTMIRDAIRGSEESIDVLMHHFTFDDLVKELAAAQERGVQVRVILNAADRDEHSGSRWDRLVAAGGQLRYKQTNPDLFQLMHHKLAIVDGELVLNGSGNWSGSGFFNNYENYVGYRETHVVRTFEDLFARLWTMSLSAESLDSGVSASRQHAADTKAFFGSLHAHIAAVDASGALLDDGRPARKDENGVEIPVDVPPSVAGAARHAFEYARDVAGLDFVALSPHCSEERDDDAPSLPNMSRDGYDSLWTAAQTVSFESDGEFVALASMEWSTNSTGNHVNVLGSREISKVERGRFDLFYDGFLRGRAAAGDRPLVMFNHPRTFRTRDETLRGSWDQIFGVNLLDIEKNSDRNKKFNDYGLDDYPPLRDVRGDWIAGSALPDEGVVADTLARVWTSAGPYARLMEVTLGRGTSLADEVADNPSMIEDDDGAIVRRTKVHSDWDYYLARGFQLAPAASHDNHWANWGTGHTTRTGIVTDVLSESSLLAAVHRRSVFASEDEDLSVRFYAAGYVPMGGATATTGSSVAGEVLIEDPDYDGPYEVRLYRGTVGDEVSEVAVRTGVADGWIELDLEVPGAGRHFFYVEILETDADRMAWTAPIWIEGL